jgi:hypothetical protein
VKTQDLHRKIKASNKLSTELENIQLLEERQCPKKLKLQAATRWNSTEGLFAICKSKPILFKLTTPPLATILEQSEQCQRGSMCLSTPYQGAETLFYAYDRNV